MTNSTHIHGEVLSAYIDGMLDLAQMRKVSEHLSVCLDCRSACGSLRDTRDLVRSLPDPPGPAPDFWQNAYRRLRVEVEVPAARLPLAERWRRSWPATHRGWATGLAAAAVLGLAALFGPISTGPDHVAPPAFRPAPAQTTDVVDISSLVRVHAQSAALQPLSDPDRQTMISADVDDGFGLQDAVSEADGNGPDSGPNAAQ